MFGRNREEKDSEPEFEKITAVILDKQLVSIGTRIEQHLVATPVDKKEYRIIITFDHHKSFADDRLLTAVGDIVEFSIGEDSYIKSLFIKNSKQQ